MISRRLFALLALAFVAGCGRGAEDLGSGEGGTIRFAVLSPEPAANLAREWAPIIADMESSTGLKVSVTFGVSAAALVDGMRKRHAEFGWFPNQAGLEAVRKADGEVFARPTLAPGEETEASVLIVAAKSKLTLDQVLKCGRSLRFGVGEALSTVASLAPETYLFAPKDIRPAECFREVRSGRRDANLDAVAAGQLDVAAVGADWLKQAQRAGRPAAGEVREIWRSPPLPESPLIWRRDLDPAVKEKLRQFFLTYGQTSPDQRAHLAAIGVAGFAPADAAYLLPVREMEATHAWLEAKRGGDKKKIEAAKRALDVITAERLELEARTGVPAAE